MGSDQEDGAAGLEITDPKVGWVYRLNKEELIDQLQQLSLETEGTVVDLRRRLVHYLRTDLSRRPTLPPPPPPVREERARSSHVPLNFDLLNQIRKLNIVFDGKSDPVSFLERWEQVQEEYEVSDDQILKTLPGLMQGKANQWYMNYKGHWRNRYDFIEDFKAFYYPPDYQENLEESISKRYQNKYESTQDFVLEMQTMIRRHGGYSREREVTCIYKHLRPEYRQYIRRRDIRNVSDLLQQAYEFDQIAKDMEHQDRTKPRRESPTHACATTRSSTLEKVDTRKDDPPKRPNNTPVITPIRNTNRNIKCWRCGETGHTRWECRGFPRLFCSRCGREGTQSRNCECSRTQGNDHGTGTSRGTSSPQAERASNRNLL